MVISAVLMTGADMNFKMSKAQIEQKARDLGMDYPSNFKVIINDKDVNK